MGNPPITIKPGKSGRIRREAKLLLRKAINSLILSVEHFNRPWDDGRIEAVLILLDHSFEMLLKASMLHKGGRIRAKRAKQTLGFDECVRVALSNADIKFLSEEDALLLQTINSLRDAAQHHLIDISEQHLYIQAQAGLTLFRRLLKDVFKEELAINLPARVLPLSTTPPTDLAKVFDDQIDEVKKLLKPGGRKRIEALAKLRSLAIIESSIQGEKLQPGEGELKAIARKVQQGKSWDHIFPGVASINITATGQGPSLDLRITKNSGTPITLVPEGTPGATVVAVKRVDELGFYSLGHHQLAEKVGLSPNKTTAVIAALHLRENPDCYKQIQIGRSTFNRYSQRAIEKIKEALKEKPIDQIWQEYRPKMMRKHKRQ
jgi:hypothetical protein